jgi:hypothetical protein
MWRADGGDEGDQDAAGEGAVEGNLAVEGVVAVAADAEVNEQERRHHDGVAESQAAVAGAVLVSDVASNLGVSVPTLYRWIPASAMA